MSNGEVLVSMRMLRGVKYSAKATTFLLLAFGTASILTLSGSRSAHAESPLVGTVRCLLQTVLLSPCQTTQAPATTAAEPAQQVPAAESPSNSSAATPSTPAATSKQPASVTPSVEPITSPQPTVEMMPDIQQPASPQKVSGTRMSGAEYLAFFNTYSKYAIGTPETASDSVVTQSSEGWRVLGIAWYWWAGIILAAGLVFISVKHKILRKTSILS